MKLVTLAAAIAVATLSVSAQAYEFKISGDINIGYFSKADEVQENGSELNFDVKTKKHNGVVFMAHTELDINGIYSDDDEPRFEEIRAGAKGKFGEVWFGDQSNACDKLQKGGDFHKLLGASTNGCKNTPKGTVLYMRKFGGTRVGVSHNPREDESAIAVRHHVTKKTVVAAGYVVSDGDKFVSVSGTTHIGPATLKTRIRNQQDGDTIWSVHAKYNVGKNDFYGALEDDDTLSLGYKRKFGRSGFLVEARNKDGEGDIEYAVGVTTEWK